MRKVYVNELRPGLVLGKTIYNERGDVLLARDVSLTPAYIEALRAHGFYAVYVLDGMADDIEPPDILSDRVRLAAYKHVRELFALAHTSTAPRAGAAQAEPLLNLNLSGAGGTQVTQLYRDVEKIVDEVTSVATLSGVVSLKSHDNYTFEHSVEVTVAGVLLGERLGLSVEDLHQLALGCLCHDLGKKIVPPEILNKPGRLSTEEFDVVKGHPRAGYEAMQQITSSDAIMARQVAWQHHERQDGTGYPRSLRGNNSFRRMKSRQSGQGNITPAAEIAAVADVYSALVSDRPYRPALTSEETVTTLQRMAGIHLNREILTRFLSILPTYPVGTQVLVIAGKLQGYHGMVTEVDPRDVHRPRVRILVDPKGAVVDPFEIDTSKDRDIQLAVPPNSLAPEGVPA